MTAPRPSVRTLSGQRNLVTANDDPEIAGDGGPLRLQLRSPGRRRAVAGIRLVADSLDELRHPLRLHHPVFQQLQHRFLQHGTADGRPLPAGAELAGGGAGQIVPAHGRKASTAGPAVQKAGQQVDLWRFFSQKRVALIALTRGS